MIQTVSKNSNNTMFDSQQYSFSVFLSEVIDSLARGFEDKLQCDNLILEINSSRYAYNVTVREVNIVKNSLIFINIKNILYLTVMDI